MKNNQLYSRMALVFLMTALLATTMIPQAASGDSMKEGNEFIWNTDLNITAYYPDTFLGYYTSVDGIPTLESIQHLESRFEAHAMRDVKVYWDSDRDMIAAEFILKWSTNSKAIHINDYREMQRNSVGIGLSSTDNDTMFVVDVVPDKEVINADVSLSPLVPAGDLTKAYENETAIDTSAELIVDLATNFNYTAGNWLFLEDFKAKNAENVTISVLYADSVGDITGQSYLSVLNSEIFIYKTDYQVKLPEPVNSGYSYIDKVKFDDIIVDEWRIYKFSSDYSDSRSNTNYRFNTRGGVSAMSLQPNGFFDNLLTVGEEFIDNVVDYATTDSNAKASATRDIGYEDLDKSAEQGIEDVLGEDPVDYQVNSGEDVVETPSGFSSSLFGWLSDAFDSGEDNEQSIIDKAKDMFSSAALTTGGDDRTDDPSNMDSGIELFSSILGGIIGGGGASVFANSGDGSSFFDGLTNSLGHLPSIPGMFMTQLSPEFGIPNPFANLKYIALAVVGLIAVMIVIKTMK